MKKNRVSHTIGINLLIVTSVVAVFPSRVLALGDSIEIPEHASPAKYGNGWVCDQGYREVIRST
jgi:hypothetical protein